MPDEVAPQEEAGLGTVAADVEGGAAAPEDATPDWKQTYLKDTDLLDNPSLATIKNPLDLAKAFVETKAMVGKKGVLLPGKNATPEEMDTFYKALGRPETVDGYEIAKPADLPKEFPYNEDLIKEFKDLAFKEGLKPSTVKALYDWQMSHSMGEFKAFQDTFTQVEGLGYVPKQWVDDHNKAAEELKTELGDKYGMMMKKATIAVMKFGGQDLKDFVDKTGFGDNPALIRAWIKVADATLTEDEFVSSNAGGMSRKERIAAINNDPALLDTTNLQKQRALVAERNRLIDEEYKDTSA